MSGNVHAPEIDLPGLEWLNVERPLSLAALRGKLVILDFWTFCCINCMHVLPTLRRVEDAFPTELAVIGVHSPKFAAERDAANVRAAIARYGIRHPVVHDPEFRLWRAYAVRAWPTLVFVAPDGTVLGQHAGEPDPEALLAGVGEFLGQARAAGALRPAPLALAPAAPGTGRLAFPGKIKAWRRNGATRWVIADSGHHQIVVVDERGAEIARIGAGAGGRNDGPLAEARFDGPQGLVAEGDVIYVADTGNHAIRKVDLAAGQVATLAGTGRRGPALGHPAPAVAAALASPWDLALDGHRLYFANAGTHQLGQLDLAAGTVAALAGDSGEAIEDGPALAARLAQPSGLALDAGARQLYFVDSETSAVRELDLDAGRVRTLVGHGLFDFGHRNGAFGEARLQHPLGIDWAPVEGTPGRLYVADSYNGRVRAVDLAAQRIDDVDGEGFVCADPVCLPAGEPAGVAVAGLQRLLVADTNNHRVLEYDLVGRSYRTWFA
jgi:thiol-disulfide isomerase/thioredoxin/sugar lactone lactonase YvrE